MLFTKNQAKVLNALRKLDGEATACGIAEETHLPANKVDEILNGLNEFVVCINNASHHNGKKINEKKRWRLLKKAKPALSGRC